MAHAHVQSIFLAVKPVTPVLFISFPIRLSFSMDEKEAEKSVHLEMRNSELQSFKTLYFCITILFSCLSVC